MTPLFNKTKNRSYVDVYMTTKTVHQILKLVQNLNLTFLSKAATTGMTLVVESIYFLVISKQRFLSVALPNLCSHMKFMTAATNILTLEVD